MKDRKELERHINTINRNIETIKRRMEGCRAEQTSIYISEMNALREAKLKIEVELYTNEYTREAIFQVKDCVDSLLKRKDITPKSTKLCLKGEFFYSIEIGKNSTCYQLKEKFKTLSTLFGFLREVDKGFLTIKISPRVISVKDFNVKDAFESYGTSTRAISKFNL